MAGIASRVPMQRAQIRRDRRDTRLRLVGAIHVRAARVAVLLVPIVGTGPRIRIFDQTRGRRRRIPVAVAVVREIAGAQVNEAGAGATHNPLVKVVAHRIVVGDKLENRRVALRHVVETHRNRALTGTLIGKRDRWRLALAARSNSGRHPGEEIASAVIELLPHLKKTMSGVAGERQLIWGVMT